MECHNNTCMRAALQYPSLKTVRDAIEGEPSSTSSQQQPEQQQQPPPSSSSSSQLQAIMSPSILAADFANLAAELARVEAGGADWVHVDMFDGESTPGWLTHHRFWDGGPGPNHSRVTTCLGCTTFVSLCAAAVWVCPGWLGCLSCKVHFSCQLWWLCCKAPLVPAPCSSRPRCKQGRASGCWPHTPVALQAYTP